MVDPVACTPASGWEKGQVENQVGLVRERFFTPRLRFKNFDELNVWLTDRCIAYAKAHKHPEFTDKTIGGVEGERPILFPMPGGLYGFHAVPAGSCHVGVLRAALPDAEATELGQRPSGYEVRRASSTRPRRRRSAPGALSDLALLDSSAVQLPLWKLLSSSARCTRAQPWCNSTPPAAGGGEPDVGTLRQRVVHGTLRAPVEILKN